MSMFRKKARPICVIYLNFTEVISLYQKKGSKMIRGSEDTAERYKQDIFKLNHFLEEKFLCVKTGECNGLTIRGLNHLKALF